MTLPAADMRIEPALSPRKIVAMAVTGPLVALVALGSVTFLGSATKENVAVESAEQNSPVAPTTTPVVVANDWLTFVSNDGRFSVQLPKEPVVAQGKTDAGSTTAYSAVTLDGHSQVEVAVVSSGPPAKGTSDATLLKNVLNAIAKATGMTATGQTVSTSGGTQTLDALLTKGTLSANTRVIRHGDRTYVLSVTNDQSAVDPAAFTKLTKSFVHRD